MQQVELTILKETRKQDTHSLFITPCEAWAKRSEASERMRTPKNTNKQEEPSTKQRKPCKALAFFLSVAKKINEGEA